MGQLEMCGSSLAPEVMRRFFAADHVHVLDTTHPAAIRRLGEQLSIRTRAGVEKAVIADVFPAYDDDGGLLVALTPVRG